MEALARSWFAVENVDSIIHVIVSVSIGRGAARFACVDRHTSPSRHASSHPPVDRRDFLRSGAAALAAAHLPAPLAAAPAAAPPAAAPAFILSGHRFLRPLAITMWDFSWLERRWPGAGYEDWDQALDELKLRGYEAVRIDAYPHLLALDANATWEVRPEWNTQDWGSQTLNRVRIQPALNQFIAKCAERGIWVALSTWFQEDTGERFRWVRQPEDLARAWAATLQSIDAAGLLGNILYVDLVNEWPIPPWTPFLTKAQRESPAEMSRWTRTSIARLKERYPRLSYTFSYAGDERAGDVKDFAFLELHVWMAQSGYYDEVGYKYERFTNTGYENLVKNAERVYRARPEHWKGVLREKVRKTAAESVARRLPLITTECWAIVDYKDWPGLDWGWVKEVCEVGVLEAARTGRWVAMATSNFCGPQFRGMWRDVAWHQRLTAAIRRAPVAPDLLTAA